MEAKVEQAANEIKRLKAFINNLISVPALPAIWSGGQPPQIVGAFARHAAADEGGRSARGVRGRLLDF
jgi:hypothetical protein